MENLSKKYASSKKYHVDPSFNTGSAQSAVASTENVTNYIPVLGQVLNGANALGTILSNTFPSIFSTPDKLNAQIMQSFYDHFKTYPYMMFVYTGSDALHYLTQTDGGQIPQQIAACDPSKYPQLVANSTYPWISSDGHTAFPYIYAYVKNFGTFNQTDFETWFNNGGSTSSTQPSQSGAGTSSNIIIYAAIAIILIIITLMFVK